MPAKRIKIITGPIHSGKTSRISNWVKARNDCAGILSPVIDNMRYLYSIHSKKIRLLEVENLLSDTSKIVSIGRYTFSKEIFNWGQKELLQGFNGNFQWLIIDEIGPLELQGQGLEPTVGQIIEKYKLSNNNQLLLVVRDQLLEKFISHYGLSKHTIDFVNL